MPSKGISATKTTAGTNSATVRLNSTAVTMISRPRTQPRARLYRLPTTTIRPVMKGKVPDSTPAVDQPMPLSRLCTTIAIPNVPVIAAVSASSARRENIDCLLDQPALLLGNLVHARAVLGHVVGEFLAGQEHLALRALLDIVLPLRRRLHLLHQVDIEGGLLRRDLERQPHGARLLEQRDVEPGLDTGRDVAPALGRRDLRAGGQALGVEHAEGPLGAAFPLADALARIVDVAV